MGGRQGAPSRHNADCIRLYTILLVVNCDFIKRNVVLSIIRIIVKMMKNNLLLMLLEINKDIPKYIFGLDPSSVDTNT